MARRNQAPKKRAASAEVSQLEVRTREAAARTKAAKERAHLAKQQAKEARKLFKQAKKVAKRAKDELQSLSVKLKGLLGGVADRISDGAARFNDKPKQRGKRKVKARAPDAVASAKKPVRRKRASRKSTAA